MQTRNRVVHRVIVDEESQSEIIVIQQCVHSGDVRGGHFDVEEKVEWNAEDVDQEVVECRFVRHSLVAAEHVIHRAEPDDEEVHEEVMARQNISQ